MDHVGLQVSRKAILVVLFVPSVERDGVTTVDQGYWVEAALDSFGELFGGPPPSRGRKACGVTMSEAASSSKTNPSLFTATRHPRRSRIRPDLANLEVSAGGWAATPVKAKSVW